jgi:sarcosine oxidase subunit alpha
MPWLELEGRRVPIEPGDTVASAMYRAGVRVFSRSFKYHRARGLYCLTGDCPNCLLTVDGEPCVRACVTPAADGQSVRRENGWPSADRDALALLWRLRRLLPVGFYYKALLRPGFAWRLAEPPIRRLAGIGRASLAAAPAHRELRHHHADVLLAGGGPAGVAAALEAAYAGERVVLADEGELEPAGAAELRAAGVAVLERAPVVGIYEGPLVPVDGEDRLHLVHPGRVVVATGAVERHSVFPGNDLPGVWLGRGAARLVEEHGLLPGRRVAFAGTTEESLEHLDRLLAAGVEVAACLVPPELATRMPAGVRVVEGAEIVGARGRKGVRAVVIAVGGRRETIRCDAVVLSFGLVPRDGLLRQASGLPVEAVGDAALAPVLPPEPRDGFVCLCEDVEAHDLEVAWEEGFRSTELLKRYTTATMGPCQGALCQGALRAFVRARADGGTVSAATTARPPARPLRLEDAAAGVHFAIEQRTGLHDRHLELGARMEWAGAWKRPESYGDPLAEYRAVRQDVSVMDVGTLGKFLVGGRDATVFLERVYPCRVADLEPGRLRYALLLNEAGYVFDDGTIAALPGGRYYLSFTSGGAEAVEAWLRDWAETWGYDVHLVNRTAAVGAINLVGPRARELLACLSTGPLGNDAFPYMHHRELDVAGVPCRTLRLGFTGELGYELHHPRSAGVRLWDALLEAGADLGIRPHGLEALRLLRLEKAHVIVGQDTDFDSTPAKLGLEFAVQMDKPEFVGRTALERIGRRPLDQRLAKLVFDGEAPPEGTPLSVEGRHAGHLTSSRFSPTLGHGVALGWVRALDGAFPETVEAAGARGRIVKRPFYDPEGARLRA